MRRSALCLLLLLLLTLAAPAAANQGPPAPAANEWLLRLVTDEQTAAYLLPLDYTADGVDYTLTEPCLPLSLLAEAAGLPLFWRSFNGQGAALWPDENAARIFLPGRPEVWHIARQKDGWQAAAEVQTELPRLINGRLCLPISYLDCLGLAYTADIPARTLTVYLPKARAADAAALWAAAEPQLKELLSPRVTLLGEAAASFDAAAIDRSQNVLLAADALQGLVVAPGAAFSFEQAVGPRTAARGYRGESIAADVSLINATVYRAALAAGLAADENSGWRNGGSLPVQLVCRIKGGRLTVQIYRLDDPAAAGRFLGSVAS